MKVTIAGKAKEFDEAININKLIEVENVENPLYVTVVINDEFIAREDFETTTIKDGDSIEFLYFMGGGAF